MTRGKNGNKAANREQAALQREAPLRNEITRLKTRLAKSEADAAAQRLAHTEETRKMRDLIAASTSERLDEALAQIEDLKTERDQALRVAEGGRRAALQITDFVYEHFTEDHGLNPEQIRDLPIFEAADEPTNGVNMAGAGAKRLTPGMRKQLRQVKAARAWSTGQTGVS